MPYMCSCFTLWKQNFKYWQIAQKY